MEFLYILKLGPGEGRGELGGKQFTCALSVLNRLSHCLLTFKIFKSGVDAWPWKAWKGGDLFRTDISWEHSSYRYHWLKDKQPLWQDKLLGRFLAAASLRKAEVVCFYLNFPLTNLKGTGPTQFSLLPRQKLGCTHTLQVLISETKCSTINSVPGLPIKHIWVKIKIQLNILFLDNIFYLHPPRYTAYVTHLCKPHGSLCISMQS